MVLILCVVAKNKRNKAQIYSRFWFRFDGIVHTTSSVVDVVTQQAMR